MGSSSWNAAHLFQMIETGDGNPHFFDYGLAKNFLVYGQEIPPIYDPSRINSTHMAFFYTKYDWFNHMKSIDLLKQKLKGKDFFQILPS